MFESESKNGEQKYFLVCFGEKTERFEINKQLYYYLEDMVDKGGKYEKMKYIIENLKRDVDRHTDSMIRLDLEE